MIKVKLGNYIKLIGGGTPSKKIESYWNGDIPWASVKDLKLDYIYKTQDSITKEGVENSATNIIPCESLIIATRMAVGKVAITKIRTAINQDLKAIQCNAEIDKKFLFFLLKSKANYFNRVSSGATVKGIKINHILDLKIPLPTLPQQKKIAARLDAADRLRQLNRQVVEKYGALTESLFLEMFGDPASNPKNWKKEKFEYFASFDTQMTSDFEFYANYPHIGIANIEKRTGIIKDYQLVKEENLTSGKYTFSPEHIIYSKIRPNLNKVALPNFHGLCSADSYPILVNKKHTNRLFFTHILRSKSFVNFILGYSTRTNIPKANKSQMKKYVGIAPPLQLQTQFATRVQAIEAQKAQAETALARSEELFQALLQAAFVEG